ncbi:DNA adenine methylase [Tardiphaga sp.]|uniref:DNA adenine methylase n=1 Tax=Tardiphaga sp. TaxID=1926292 RepID=UPI002623F488|nr:DNA adenine methylase [Tardiphaga sp.]
MGSKRSMLLNGLGEAIQSAVPGHKRFVDMFTGSAAVAWHVAQKYDVEVLAGDLQKYSVVLASSVIGRTKPLKRKWLEDWADRATTWEAASDFVGRTKRLQKRIATEDIKSTCDRARDLCAEMPYPISKAYGGYYFSPQQSLTIDALRATLPLNKDARCAALASLIWVASRCAAAPGHTAQSFKPNLTAGEFLKAAWQRDVGACLHQSYDAIAPMFSKRKGAATKTDANDMASTLKEGDIAFLDPPYSGVHYSRFYHVLETLVGGKLVAVSGEGRYPEIGKRPQSKYSLVKSSEDAFEALLKSLASVGTDAIITFPAGEASNGLSGERVTELANQFFRIKSSKVTSRFSTLGGNSRNRDARQPSEEMILTLTAR